MEIHCLQAIANLPERAGIENCIELRNYDVDNDRRWYRIYTSFCPHGNLGGLFSSPAYHQDLKIPEAALWAIFNDLVRAALVLQYGAVEEQDAVPSWKPIVHRDLKHQNVFLDEPGGEEFPSYPRVRIGDFGQSIRTDENDPMNPYAYAWGGTPGWLPFEQKQLKSARTLHPIKGELLSEKTNVWVIGAIVIQLMNREPFPDDLVYRRQVGTETHIRPAAPQLRGAGAGYTIVLTALVQRCVRFKPADRPTLRYLREEILRSTNPEGDLDLARGMRTDPRQPSEEFRLRCPEVDPYYRMGFMRTSQD